MEVSYWCYQTKMKLLYLWYHSSRPRPGASFKRCQDPWLTCGNASRTDRVVKWIRPCSTWSTTSLLSRVSGRNVCAKAAIGLASLTDLSGQQLASTQNGGGGGVSN